jgi:oligopeptide transport system substrate-binding protein
MKNKLFNWSALAFASAIALGAATVASAQQVLHRGNGAEPETLDPQKSTGVPEAMIAVDLFEGLVTYGLNAETVPGVAEKWDVSKDGTVYTFYLRANAKWSNGDPVTAEDFVYSFRRLVDPATAAEYAWVVDAILNAEQIRTAEEKDITKLGVKALNARTLEITLKASTPYFLSLLQHHSTWPVHKATVEKFGDQWTRPGNSVSNGAYMMAEWMPQSRIMLKKNPYFHDAKNVKIDTIYYYPTESIAEEFKRFQAGELHITNDIPTDQIDFVRKNLASETHISPYFGTYAYEINLTKAPLGQQVKLRQALSLAIDRSIITDKIWKAGQVPAYGWVPPGVPGYKQQQLDYAKLTQAERNALAKKLYAEAGYGPNKVLKVEILFNTSENHKLTAVAVQSMWKQVLGVETTLTNQEWKVYLDSRDQKNYQIARAAWIGDYIDAQTFLDMYKSNAGTANRPGYNNKEFDALLDKAAVTQNAQERQNLQQQAEKIFLNDMPLIPIYFYVNKHLVKQNVQGWQDNVMGFHLTRYMSLKK